MKSGQRERELRAAADRSETSVFFESPYRILKTLAACRALMPGRPLCLARELTKRFEEFRRGVPGELLAHYQAHPAKGEIVLVIGNSKDQSEPCHRQPAFPAGGLTPVGSH